MASDPRFNVMFQLENLLNLVKVPVHAPLFSFSDINFHTRHSLVRLLEMCVTEAGLTPADYSWHSFRRGAAVFAFDLGLQDSAVQLLGDWSSSSFKDYLEFAFDRKLDVTEAISESFDECVLRQKL